VLVAVIDREGVKHPLRADRGATEHGAVVQALIVSRISRIFGLAVRRPSLAHAVMAPSSAGPSAARCSDIFSSTTPCRRCGVAWRPGSVQTLSHIWFGLSGALHWLRQ
jgi:hypothetical protein